MQTKEERDNARDLIGIPKKYLKCTISPDLVVARIPERISNLGYERPQFIKLAFDPIQLPKKDSGSITTKSQRNYLSILLDGESLDKSNARILITAQGTDELPMIALSVIAKNFHTKNPLGRTVRIVGPNFCREKKKFEKEINFLGIYNIFSGSQDWRIQEVRDLIRCADSYNCPVVIAASGIDPFDLRKRLNIEFDGIISFSDSVCV